MRLKERQKRDLKKAIEELTTEYNKAVENDYVLKPMAYTLYHLWKRWDAKEHSRTSNTIDGITPIVIKNNNGDILTAEVIDCLLQALADGGSEE